MHMAAVRADRILEPVRGLGTFTADLDRLVDWFIECGVETVVMEFNQRLSIPILNSSMPEDLLCSCQRPRCQACTRAQDRCQRCAVAAAPPFVRTAAGELSAQRPDCGAASIRASARAPARVCGLPYPAHAEGSDRDEPSAPPRRRRRHRRNGSADHPRNTRRRA